MTYSPIEHVEARLTKAPNRSLRLPKTYPRVLPTLTIEEPVGLSKTQVNQLLNAIKAEGQKALGEVMVFQVCGSISFLLISYRIRPMQLVNFSQDWITNHHTLPAEDGTKLSLAEEMENRATQKQRVSHSRSESF